MRGIRRVGDFVQFLRSRNVRHLAISVTFGADQSQLDYHGDID